MRVQDYHDLPKLRDGLSYLYAEHCRVDQEAKAIAIHDMEGKVPVPCANLALLMLGPGVSISHAAVSVLADHGCLVVWCGEEGVRFYASGMGETRNARNILHQAAMWADEEQRIRVVRKMYEMRFPEALEPGLTIQQIRGKEGVRVRQAYAAASRETGVEWSGRSYRQDSWGSADPINRALSAANACLYGLCHAAIVSAGFSPALGFIHTGKMLSFVYDVADLYKTEITIPAAFYSVAEGESDIEKRVRHACRGLFVAKRLLARIIPDIQSLLFLEAESDRVVEETLASRPAQPGGLWDPREGVVAGGKSYGGEDDNREVSNGRHDS